MKKIWVTTRGKNYSKVTSNRIEKKDVTFCVKVKFETDDYFFKIDGLKDTDEVDNAMDKILTYLDQQKSKVDKNKIFEATFDSENEEWVVKDILKEAMEKNSKG